MTLAFFVGAMICGLRGIGFGESCFAFITGGGSAIFTSSAGVSLTIGTDVTSRFRVEAFLIAGRGASLTTGFGAGGSGCGSGSGVVTVFSTIGGSTLGGDSCDGAGGRARACELLNTSAPTPPQRITMNVAITASGKILFLDELRPGGTCTSGCVALGFGVSRQRATSANVRAVAQV